jgi:hypothetical protein
VQALCTGMLIHIPFLTSSLYSNKPLSLSVRCEEDLRITIILLTVARSYSRLLHHVLSTIYILFGSSRLSSGSICSRQQALNDIDRFLIYCYQTSNNQGNIGEQARLQQATNARRRLEVAVQERYRTEWEAIGTA